MLFFLYFKLLTVNLTKTKYISFTYRDDYSPSFESLNVSETKEMKYVLGNTDKQPSTVRCSHKLAYKNTKVYAILYKF